MENGRKKNKHCTGMYKQKDRRKTWIWQCLMSDWIAFSKGGNGSETLNELLKIKLKLFETNLD